jgi:hypothetical protein
MLEYSGLSISCQIPLNAGKSLEKIKPEKIIITQKF